MKHVYVAVYHDGLAREIVCVARTRKALRKAVTTDWHAGGHTRRLIWKKRSWAPFLESTTPGGLGSSPYTVEKHGVL